MERWTLRLSKSSCAGCVYLSRAGPFPFGSLPRRPLHPNCGCRVEAIDVTGFSPGARIALGRQARKNGRRIDRMLDRARELSVGHHGALSQPLRGRQLEKWMSGRRSKAMD